MKKKFTSFLVAALAFTFVLPSVTIAKPLDNCNVNLKGVYILKQGVSEEVDITKSSDASYWTPLKNCTNDVAVRFVDGSGDATIPVVNDESKTAAQVTIIHQKHLDNMINLAINGNASSNNTYSWRFQKLIKESDGWHLDCIVYVPEYTVTIISKVLPNKEIKVLEKDTVKLPDAEEVDGYEFNGYYVDDSYTTIFNPSTPIVSSINIYARYDKVEEEEEEPEVTPDESGDAEEEITPPIEEEEITPEEPEKKEEEEVIPEEKEEEKEEVIPEEKEEEKEEVIPEEKKEETTPQIIYYYVPQIVTKTVEVEKVAEVPAEPETREIVLAPLAQVVEPTVVAELAEEEIEPTVIEDEETAADEGIQIINYVEDKDEEESNGYCFLHWIILISTLIYMLITAIIAYKKDDLAFYLVGILFCALLLFFFCIRGCQICSMMITVGAIVALFEVILYKNENKRDKNDKYFY